jgi:hypothetical protein
MVFFVNQNYHDRIDIEILFNIKNDFYLYYYNQIYYLYSVLIDLLYFKFGFINFLLY